MQPYSVSIAKYEKERVSLKQLIDLSGALSNLPKKAKVFIKPNIVFWTSKCPFPKWGVITTSRIIEDMVILLKKDYSIDDIVIGEGINTVKINDRESASDAYEKLGYKNLEKKYGVKCINIFDRPFKRVHLADNSELNVNADLLDSDFLINMPVLKTHAQTILSGGVKNLKGLLSNSSRKNCHSSNLDRDLNFMISLIPSVIPPSATIIDGIYTLDKGPMFFGNARRSNIIIASSDLLSADMVCAKILGYHPSDIPSIAYFAKRVNRIPDLRDIAVVGKKFKRWNHFMNTVGFTMRMEPCQ